MDEIDGMNNGDKGGINALIKLIRPKKTKKQKQDFDTSGDNFINPHEFKVFFARALRNVSNADFEKSMKDLIGGKLA